MKDTNKPYDYVVFIGRFQPIHLGHLAILQKCFEIAKTPLIIVGSSTASRSLRNPFTFEEREKLIHASIRDLAMMGVCDGDNYRICPVPDSAYNFHDWLIRIKSLVTSLVASPQSVSTKKPSIAIIGHYKDDTSYYFNYFPEYTFIPVDAECGISGATEIRDQLFSCGGTGKLMRYCTLSTRNFVLSWLKTPEFKRLAEEYAFIQDYKKQWATAPYPPTFVTTDSIAICLGHVLVIKRGRNPGKGLYALPGGFLDQNETIQNGCIRELKEETHIDVPKQYLEAAIHDSHVFDHPLRDPRGRTITHAYLFNLNSKDLPAVRADDDASEALWLPLQDLSKMETEFFNDHAQIIRYFIARLT